MKVKHQKTTRREDILALDEVEEKALLRVVGKSTGICSPRRYELYAAEQAFDWQTGVLNSIRHICGGIRVC